MNLLIKNANILLVNHFEKKDIRVRNGKISDIKINLIPEKNESLIICEDDEYLLPGFIDAHTHFGLGSGSDATADNFFDASKLAASSGITTFIDFSDQVKDKTLVEGALERIQEANDSSIDFTLHQGFYRMHKNAKSELLELKKSGINTLKIFTTYKKYGVYLDPKEYDKLFKLCKELEILICCHSEDESVIEKVENSNNFNFKEYYTHAKLRPAEAEEKAINSILTVAKKYNLPIYIVHVSSKKGMNTIEAFRKDTIVVAETTNHYVLLDKSYLNNSDGFKYLMTPPLRDKEDNQALQMGIEKNFFDIVASDHCSYYDNQKSSFDDIRDIPSGIPGSQELPLILSGILGDSDEALIKLNRLASLNPSKIFGLFPQKGIIAEGSDGDFVIIKKEKSLLKSEDILSKSKFSAYINRLVNIKPIYTILRGKILVKNGEFNLEKGYGTFVKTTSSSVFTPEYPQENYIH
jgi:dihydropyrimidinase